MLIASRTAVVLPVILVASLFASNATAALNFHFEDRFTVPEQIKLKTWITEVAAGVESLVGPYPFDVEVRFARVRSRRGPVPWANTQRGRYQGIRFHVDTRHTLEDFRRDWVAPHELSHLILPYLGGANAWFAEGFASYMQHQVMHATGALSREAAAQRYQRRLDEAARGYRYPDRPFVDVASKLRAQRKFRTMYWGGAAYFLQLDQILRADRNTSLIKILSAYLRCCRRDRDNLHELTATFDRLIGSGISAGQLAAFRVKTGFPHYGQIEPSVVD